MRLFFSYEKLQKSRFLYYFFSNLTIVEHTVKPVSYTHLDVYKRQVAALLWRFENNLIVDSVKVPTVIN